MPFRTLSRLLWQSRRHGRVSGCLTQRSRTFQKIFNLFPVQPHTMKPAVTPPGCTNYQSKRLSVRKGKWAFRRCPAGRCGGQKARLNGTFVQTTEGALFLLAAGGRFLFRQDEKENGGRIACMIDWNAGKRQKDWTKTKKRGGCALSEILRRKFLTFLLRRRGV